MKNGLFIALLFVIGIAGGGCKSFGGEKGITASFTPYANYHVNEGGQNDAVFGASVTFYERDQRPANPAAPNVYRNENNVYGGSASAYSGSSSGSAYASSYSDSTSSASATQAQLQGQAQGQKQGQAQLQGQAQGQKQDQSQDGDHDHGKGNDLR